MIYLEFAKLFSELDNVLAITLAGSSVAPISDSYSDYDLYVYTSSPILPSTRSQLLAKLGGKVQVQASFFEEGDEVSFEEGPYLDIMYRDASWIDSQVKDVWELCNGRLGYSTCFIFSIVNSRILFERGGWHSSLLARVSTPYPEALRQNIIRRNMIQLCGPIQSPYIKQLELAIKRDDLVSMNHRLSAMIASYFDVLFACSCKLHPGEKKLERYVKAYQLATPENWEKDLRLVLQASADKKSLLGYVQALLDNLKAMLAAQAVKVPYLQGL
ncbi:MAG: hypothetical protein PHI83_01020 [Sphaerochaetaceae bacterium]|jgi:hypothetical protein|nr:hypothetical protein [Sphaerochaetaceae bacterium]